MQVIQDGKFDAAAFEAFFKWGEELDKLEIEVPDKKRAALAPVLDEMRAQLPADRHAAWERFTEIVLMYNALSAARRAN
ncbi:hypothetical protein [Prauserella rugosa]|uniref:Uncharacterized protein n=1 Tax=Prauserella rugosa TaxID=43354 RepID=A0A660CIU0_9PSEU|nr:hypothetical protein [Prauserella rugosa]TWH21543.1 hypothetical protein JD82_03408 [Prauserella rugosa]